MKFQREQFFYRKLQISLTEISKIKKCVKNFQNGINFILNILLIKLELHQRIAPFKDFDAFYNQKIDFIISDC